MSNFAQEQNVQFIACRFDSHVPSSSPMITKPQLAALAASVNAEALAEAAGISTKTVYRIRLQKANPSMDTIAAIESAVAKLAAAAPRPKATAQASGA